MATGLMASTTVTVAFAELLLPAASFTVSTTVLSPAFAQVKSVLSSVQLTTAQLSVDALLT